MPQCVDLAETPDPADPLEEQALAVLIQLRPDLTAERWALVRTDPDAQRPRFSVLVEDEQVRAVAGWRLLAQTTSGRTLYVDDLSADAAVRSRGHGAALLAYLKAKAELAGASTLTLDSGVQRHDAHRFYLRERMDITAHHFTRVIQ